MSQLNLLISALDEGHRELAIALDGLSDADVWQRPYPNLLSVGEIVGHVAYGEATWLLPARVGGATVSSVFIDQKFRYYLRQIAQPVTLDMGAKAVAAEISRVHEEIRASILVLDPKLEDSFPGDTTISWGDRIKYMIFHVGYHTGQIYSVRHIFGHKTEDN
jgi:hypothetical protein